MSAPASCTAKLASAEHPGTPPHSCDVQSMHSPLVHHPRRNAPVRQAAPSLVTHDAHGSPSVHSIAAPNSFWSALVAAVPHPQTPKTCAKIASSAIAVYRFMISSRPPRVWFQARTVRPFFLPSGKAMIRRCQARAITGNPSSIALRHHPRACAVDASGVIATIERDNRQTCRL